MNKKDAIVFAKKFVVTLVNTGIPVETAYLFGSYAKGKADIHSDIDICIISPKFGQDRQRNRLRLMNISHKISDLIEPHPFTLEEFENPYDPFVKEVKKGVKVV